MKSLNPASPLSHDHSLPLWGGTVKGNLILSNRNASTSYPVTLFSGGRKYVRLSGAQHTVDGIAESPLVIENSSDGGSTWTQIGYLPPINATSYTSNTMIMTYARTKSYVDTQIGNAIAASY